MRIAYLDCPTGISGDMTLAALIDAGVDSAAVRRAVDSLGLDGVRLTIDTIVKGGFRARKVTVEHPEQHAHRHLSDVRQLLDTAAITPAQRDLALRIFTAVAEAEAKVHGMSIENVHFHEVGAIDSIVDILGAAVGFALLDVDEVICSPLPPGRGQVHIDHGICPLPAPGTAELLTGIPLAEVPIEAELTTPTGAAIAKVLAHRFGPLPAMNIEHIGLGAGTMDFPQRANILRLFVGTASSAPPLSDHVVRLETNLDDVSPELVGHTTQRLLEAGALDVWSTPLQMKKSRPGVMLSVLCRPRDADAMESILFAETGTLGIRRQTIERSLQHRTPYSVETRFGPIAGKLAWRDPATVRFTPEYNSAAAIAREQSVSLHDIYEAATVAFDPHAPEVKSHVAQAHAPPSESSHAAIHYHDHDHDHDHG